MKSRTTRRAAISTAGAGLAGIAILAGAPPQAAIAAMSSAAGVAAGGSLDGPNGPIQFSAFGSRLDFDDGTDPVFLGVLSWYDPAGTDGEELRIVLTAIDSYGKINSEGARLMTGAVSVNGDGDHPFALLLVDAGEIGASVDSVRLVVGPAVSELSGTPVPADADSSFAYDVEGDLTAGDVALTPG